MLSEKIFKDGLKKLSSAFPGFEIKSKDQFEVWYEFTKGLSDKQYMKKINTCIRTCRHIPYIADVLDLKDGDKFEPANAAAYQLI